MPFKSTMKKNAELPASDDLNAWDELGMTPLLLAVFRGDLEAVRLLLQAGADPNRPRRDDPTATPLWHARDDFGLHEIAELLVKAGAK
jgi:ankyrin repeat protein